MSNKSSDNTASRRDFFRNLFSDPSKKPVQDSDAVAAMKRRASVLALRYGQNEAELTQIGVEEPKKIGEKNLYEVKIKGYTPNDVSSSMVLHVDIAKGVARVPEPEQDLDPDNEIEFDTED
jgi:hypothetical protein